MQANADGYYFLKFFPAVQAGGIAMLKALAGPFGDVVFCPTGGISAEDRAAVPRAVERQGLRRLVADAGGCRRREGLGPHHAAGASGERVARRLIASTATDATRHAAPAAKKAGL